MSNILQGIFQNGLFPKENYSTIHDSPQALKKKLKQRFQSIQCDNEIEIVLRLKTMLAKNVAVCFKC